MQFSVEDKLSLKYSVKYVNFSVYFLRETGVNYSFKIRFSFFWLSLSIVPNIVKISIADEFIWQNQMLVFYLDM